MTRVLIDGRVSARDGIGRYTTCLVGALRAAAGPDIHITVLAPTETPRYSLAEGTELARAAIDARADVVHVLDFRIPAHPIPVPIVATVHDVLWLEFYTRMLAWTCLQARHVVTPTATVAAQLARQVPLAAEPVPVPLGIDHLAAGGQSKSLGVAPPGYLLYVGQARKHKGLPELIAAYQRSHASASGVSLVCAGRDFEPGTDATAQTKDALRHNVTAIGEVPDSILRDLYGQAGALIHLATHEGFGLTPLEAMACGTRIVASDIPVLRETLGRHAEFVEPGSALDAARAIDKILTEPDDGRQPG